MNNTDLTSPSRNRKSRGLVLDLLAGGGTTLLVGLCLLVPAAILPPLMFPAAICIACGAAVALAGCLAFPFARRPHAA